MEYLSKIRRAQEWVAEYNRDAGEEFLQLGNALDQCHRLSKQALEVIGKVLALANASDAASPLSKAKSAVSSAIGAISQEVGHYRGVSDGLREGLRELHEIEAFNAALGLTVRPLQYICLRYGIESAWLDGQSQRELAALRETMATVQKRSTNAYEAQSVRLTEARRVVDVLAGWVANRVSTLSDAGDRTKKLLDEMDAVPNEIFVITGHLLQGMEMINRKTVELVISLQAEDAVRQNLEHVSAMLDEIASQLTTLSETGAPGGEEINWFVHEASAIQLRQVGDIQRRVEETGERVSTGLRIMVEHLAEISSEAHTLTTSAAETTRRQVTVSRLDSALESLYNSFSDAPINNDEIYGKMQAVQEMTNHIVALSRDLKMVSVNAQIRAAQLSEMQSIAALGKQAGLLSDENLQVAGNVSAGLNRLTGLMHRFGSGIAAVDAVQKSQQRELQLVSHTFTQELSEVNRRVSSELGAVCEQCSTLQQKTLQLLNGIRFIGTAGEGFGTISALIESIMRDTETCLSAEQVSVQARSLLDRCRGNYTMKIEHLLHDGAVAESVAVAPGGAGGGSEFGDNVELF